MRLGLTVGPEMIRELHDQLMAIPREHNVIRLRKMRVDTTVVGLMFTIRPTAAC